jgi:hypothetical protein
MSTNVTTVAHGDGICPEIGEKVTAPKTLGF